MVDTDLEFHRTDSQAPSLSVAYTTIEADSCVSLSTSTNTVQHFPVYLGFVAFTNRTSDHSDWRTCISTHRRPGSVKNGCQERSRRTQTVVWLMKSGRISSQWLKERSVDQPHNTTTYSLVGTGISPRRSLIRNRHVNRIDPFCPFAPMSVTVAVPLVSARTSICRIIRSATLFDRHDPLEHSM